MNKVKININDFYSKIKESYKKYLLYGSRSTEKLRPLHKWIGETYERHLNKDFKVYYLNGREMEIQGRYYKKEVDIGIMYKGNVIFAVSVKFVTSNYKQNVNNFFENLLGECANIRATNVGFGHILILRDKIPYYERAEHKIKKWEHPNDKDLGKYIRLFEDKNKFFHAPNYLCIEIITINPAPIEGQLKKGPGTSGYTEDIHTYLSKLSVSDGIPKTQLSQQFKECVKNEMNLLKFFEITVKMCRNLAKESRKNKRT